MVPRLTRKLTRLVAILITGVAVAGGLRLTCLESRAAVPRVASGGSLVSSTRAEPRTFNRYVDYNATTDTINFLTQSRLVRINRATQEAEPMLAESWTYSKATLTYTIKLRKGVKFSDGAPFTSADVMFSFRAVYEPYKKNDPKSGSAIGDSLQVAGKRLTATAVDDYTVQIKFPAPFGPGLRVLDNVLMYPKHLLEQALDEGRFREAWGVTTPPSQMAGLGPFVLKEYLPKQRLVFERNPYYWRRDGSGARLPYLDRITLEIVPDQNAEMLRLQSGQIDLTQDQIRPEDYATLKRAASQGKVRIWDLGAGLDADALWFNLRKAAKIPEAKRAWLQNVELRRAINEAIDRTQFVNTVYFGAAFPAFGPVTAANKIWFDPKIATPAFDRRKAAARLAGMGFRNRNADGILVDGSGSPARFTIITQKGKTSLERGVAVLRDQLRTIGLAVDVAPMDVGALVQRIYSGDYEAIYFGFTRTDVDPALSMDFWRSAGDTHPWNPSQPQPETEWERRVDELMDRQASTLDLSERKRLFNQVQAIFADQVPILSFAAPRLYVAASSRVVNATPVLIRPMLLWSADTVAVRKSPGTD